MLNSRNVLIFFSILVLALFVYAQLGGDRAGMNSQPESQASSDVTMAQISAVGKPVDFYSKATMTIFYADGSQEVVATPATRYELTTMAVQDFFERLAISREGKIVQKLVYELSVWASEDVPVTVKARIVRTLGQTLGETLIVRGYILEADSPQMIFSETLSATSLEVFLSEGENSLLYSATVYAATDQSVYRAKLDLSADVTKYNQVLQAGESETVSVQTVSTVASSVSPASSLPQTGNSGAGGTYVPPVSGMSSEQYVRVVEEYTGREYTDQIVVQTREGGYQPEIGTLAAQDQYAYDVTDLFLSLRETGQPPSGWIVREGSLGQTIYVNERTGSEVVMGGKR